MLCTTFISLRTIDLSESVFILYSLYMTKGVSVYVAVDKQ